MFVRRSIFAVSFLVSAQSVLAEPVGFLKRADAQKGSHSATPVANPEQLIPFVLPAKPGAGDRSGSAMIPFVLPGKGNQKTPLDAQSSPNEAQAQLNLKGNQAVSPPDGKTDSAKPEFHNDVHLVPGKPVDDSELSDAKPADMERFLPRSCRTGVLFDFQITDPKYKRFDAELPTSETGTSFIENSLLFDKGALSQTASVDLRSQTQAVKIPMAEAKQQNRPLEASICESITAPLNLNALKEQSAQTQEQYNRKLFAEAVQRHGTPGLFLISYVNGPWIIQQVLKGSSAEAAGLRAGDIIVSVDGLSVTGIPINNVYFKLTGTRGHSRTFKINRNGQMKTVVVPLWGLSEITDKRSQQIEYHWFLLYHGWISARQYETGVKPYLYFDVPKLRDSRNLKPIK